MDYSDLSYEPVSGRFLTLLRATFADAKDTGSDADSAALEVNKCIMHSLLFSMRLHALYSVS